MVLFPPFGASSSAPTAPRVITLTHIGGTIELGGHRFSLEHRELPPLTPGLECLFLLRSKGTKYEIVDYFMVSSKSSRIGWSRLQPRRSSRRNCVRCDRLWRSVKSLQPQCGNEHANGAAHGTDKLPHPRHATTAHRSLTRVHSRPVHYRLVPALHGGR
jgi:hypothetical protein